jgi:ABC-type phosphate transport system permease subunit
MSSNIAPPLLPPAARSTASAGQPLPRRGRHSSSHATLVAHGEPQLWLTGGALAISLVLIVGLLVLVVYQGIGTFWPRPIVELKLADGTVCLGEIARSERYKPERQAFDSLPPAIAAQAREDVARDGGFATRQLVRVGNFELTHAPFQWVDDFRVVKETRPEWAFVLERLENGRFYGRLEALLIDGKVVAATPEEAWQRFQVSHAEVRTRWRERVAIDKSENGDVRRAMKLAHLAQVQAGLDHGTDSPQYAAAGDAVATTNAWSRRQFKEIQSRIDRLKSENDRYRVRLKPVQGAAEDILLEDIVRAVPANQLDFWGKLGIYVSRWREFLLDEPLQSNSAGGYFPAIWGTIAMTLIMTLFAVPFGVLAALYLREYAKAGPVTSAVRIAINNLAGVPSIVFGAFGLGFFCYGVGNFIDGGPENPWPARSWFVLLSCAVVAGVAAFFLGLLGRATTAKTISPGRFRLRRLGIALWLVSLGLVVAMIVTTPFFHGFYRARLVDNDSTFGKGCLLWASLTLALLTVPVVIVATEEALAAVPNSMREGSYACGASHWQTIWRIVLPRAMPGIMTGMILAIARGAGEVAPLMLVGVKKISPELPLDTVFPYLHPDRSFMHLAYMIYDVGFQSPDSEAAKPIVYTTTLLLIAIVASLNLGAIWLRKRLRRKFMSDQF